jgi:nucleotide-binding universal stress UspA family protein
LDVTKRFLFQEHGMKYMVGFNASPSAHRALQLAAAEAKRSGALVFVVTSVEGGSGETLQDIQGVEDRLREAKILLAKEHVPCESIQLARGLSPGEDLVKFAQDNAIDHIFLGIEKKSRTRKILLGSTAQFVILRGPCPVTTIK